MNNLILRKYQRNMIKDILIDHNSFPKTKTKKSITGSTKLIPDFVLIFRIQNKWVICWCLWIKWYWLKLRHSSVDKLWLLFSGLKVALFYSLVGRCYGPKPFKQFSISTYILLCFNHQQKILLFRVQH